MARSPRAEAVVRRHGGKSPQRTRRRRRGGDGAAQQPSGIVAIVGRPNVGKSTLFNRLARSRIAIVHDEPGVTRDRKYADTTGFGRAYTVVDTGGFDPEDDDPMKAGIAGHVRAAVAEADAIVFVTDATTGPNAADRAAVKLLRESKKPVFYAANKADSPKGDAEAFELGRPNVGKSSLLNALVGEERALVSPVAGTTRDAVDTWLEDSEGPVQLVDTAGIRRRGVVTTDVEHYSLLRALRAMERSEVAVLVVDAADGIVAQDRHVAGYAADAGKALVVVANKWDLLDHEARADPDTLKKLTAAFEFVPGAPVLAVSAKDGRNIRRVLPAARMVAHSRSTRIPTPALNTLLRGAMEEHPPPYHKNRRLKLFYATQAATPSPTIVLFVNEPELLNFAYLRYLENRIRAVFPFNGSPLRLLPRRREGEKG